MASRSLSRRRCEPPSGVLFFFFETKAEPRGPPREQVSTSRAPGPRDVPSGQSQHNASHGGYFRSRRRERRGGGGREDAGRRRDRAARGRPRTRAPRARRRRAAARREPENGTRGRASADGGRDSARRTGLRANGFESRPAAATYSSPLVSR